MTRSELREQIFYLVYRASFYNAEEMDAQMGLFFDNQEKALSPKDEEYISKKSTAIIARVGELDTLINEKATGWSTARMGKVELAILRLGFYEVLFDDDIPTGVAINEAVELAKKYGGENSGSFVNAILAKIGKDDK